MVKRDRLVLDSLHWILRPKVEKVLVRVNTLLPDGIELRPFEGYRTYARQALLLKAGTTKTLLSAHCEKPSRACDLVFFEKNRWSWKPQHPWALIGAEARFLELTWGGDWRTIMDPGHVEISLTRLSYELKKLPH